MARKVSIDIVVDADQVNRGFKSIERGAVGLNSTIGQLRVGFLALAKSVVVVEAVQKAIEGLGTAVHLGIDEFKENAQVQAQTAAAIKSTGGIANVTAQQITDLGQSLSNLSGLDDEVIRKGENLLLSFTNIRNFAGKNNDIFTQATKIMVDFSVRTGRDAASAAVILGRALEDPATRVASLSRAGVVFTRQQIEQLKALEKTKGVLAAQKVLLQELEKRFGGAGKAAGQTLPGALNILRERFKDLAGEGIGLVAPALTKAAVGLADFVRNLTAAKTAHAKFHIVFEGLENVGRDLVAAVQKQISEIKDLDGVALDFARRVGNKIAQKLAQINWRSKIADAGRRVGQALAESLARIRQFIERVNWNQLGQEIVRGVELAIAAVVDFLAHVNWGAVAKQTALLLIAAFKAVASVFIGIGEAIGKQIVAGIEAGLRAAGRAAEKIALEIVLKIIEPFTHLPRDLGGGPFQQMKAEFQQTLNDMATAAASGGSTIGATVGQNMLAQVQAFLAQAKKLVQDGTTPLGPPIPTKASPAPKGPGPDVLPAPVLPAPPAIAAPVSTAKGITASQRNTFFDNQIARILLRGGLGSLQQQLAALKEAAALISARIAVTKDITRKLNLEDQLLQLVAQEKDIGKQLRQAFVDSVTAKEFKLLGLTATGDDITPGVKNLRKRLGTISDAVKGTFLDTPKLETLLKGIRKVLSEGLVPKDVRAKIKEMFDNIRDELKNGAGNLTKFAHANSAAIVAGLGLSPEQIRVLRARISQIAVGGTVPGSRSPAFAFAGANTIVMHNPSFNGVTDVREFKNQLAKEQTRRSGSRRGPYAGRH